MNRTATGTAKLSSLFLARLDELLAILRARREQTVAYKIVGKLSGCLAQANSLNGTQNGGLDFEHCKCAVQQDLFKRQDRRVRDSASKSVFSPVQTVLSRHSQF